MFDTLASYTGIDALLLQVVFGGLAASAVAWFKSGLWAAVSWPFRSQPVGRLAAELMQCLDDPDAVSQDKEMAAGGATFVFGADGDLEAAKIGAVPYLPHLEDKDQAKVARKAKAVRASLVRQIRRLCEDELVAYARGARRKK